MVKNFGYSIAVFCMRCSSSMASTLVECMCKNTSTIELKSSHIFDIQESNDIN